MEAQLLEAIEAIRPALQSDGGDVRVVNLDQENGVVDIELMGACGGCPMSTMTLKAGIERILKDRVEGLNEGGGNDARETGRLTFPRAGKAYTVGLTGAPGAGKSTITDRLIGVARSTGGEVGVLAVDPSSPFSGGAFLGDRVRMQDHALDAGVFIRSMATRGHMGGLSLATPEAIRVLDAARFPLVLIETVGVGQVEVDIAGSADTTV